MSRTTVITGAASGIGAATVARLTSAGQRVIGVDLHNADIQPEEIAELIDLLLGMENHYLVGQIIYIDGVTDMLLRPENI